VMLIPRDVQGHKVPTLTLRGLELNVFSGFKQIESVISRLLEGSSYIRVVVLVAPKWLQGLIE
jgi:hypothetical protein